MEQIITFFKVVFDAVFVLQMITAAFAAAFVLCPPVFAEGIRTKPKAITFFILKILAMFAAETLINLLFFTLSEFVPAFREINYPIAHLISGACFAAVFCKFSIKARVCMTAALFSAIIVIAELGKRLSISLNSGDWIIYLSYTLIIAFAIVLRVIGLENFSDIPKFSVALLSVDCTIFSVLVITYDSVFLEEFGSTNINNWFCLVLIGLYIISVVAYVFVYVICKKQYERAMLFAENKVLQAEKYMLGLSVQSLEDMRMLRHDIKNHIGAMRILLQEKDYEKLDEYFGKLSDDTLMPTSVIDCGNASMNAVLNMESAKARGCGILADIRAVVPPIFPFSVTDICCLLSNLIDNAIEAIERDKPKDRTVVCRINADDEYMYVRVKNYFVAKSGALLSTSKSDTSRHGLGHRIVEKIAKKYNGYVNFSVENGMFIAEVALDLKSET